MFTIGPHPSQTKSPTPANLGGSRGEPGVWGGGKYGERKQAVIKKKKESKVEKFKTRAKNRTCYSNYRKNL